MANDTVNDLRTDCLWRAGEPQDSSSKFWTRSLKYLNRVQRTLLLGGAVAVGRDLATSAGIYAHIVDLPVTDWLWLRKHPRGVITTDSFYDDGAVSITQGETSATLTQKPDFDVAGWRLQAAGHATVPRVSHFDFPTGVLTLDGPWPEETLSGVGFTLFNLEYELPSDFLRFCGEPYLHSRYLDPIPVGFREEHDQAFPLGNYFKAPPTAACLIQPRRIQLNNFDDRGYRLEFDYIFDLPDLQAGGVTPLPAHVRDVLSVGASMLIAFDKSDDKAENLASEFRELVSRMAQEHRRAISGGSRTFAVHRTRLGRSERRKGRIQPRGEQFLV